MAQNSQCEFAILRICAKRKRIRFAFAIEKYAKFGALAKLYHSALCKISGRFQILNNYTKLLISSPQYLQGG